MKFLTIRLFYSQNTCILLTLLLFLSNTLQAQDDTGGTTTDTTRYVSSFNPSLIPAKCTNPVVSGVVVVNYATKSIAKIPIQANGTNMNRLTCGAKGDAAVKPVQLVRSDDGVLIDQLQPNTEYQLSGVNSCGIPVVISEFNTYPHDPNEDGIKVSNRLYRHLSKYLANSDGALPLNQYVETLPDIDVYEKTAFLQKFLLKGALLPDVSAGILPSAYIKSVLDRDPKVVGGEPGNDDPPGSNPSSCLCEFIINQAAFAVPDAIEENQSVDRVHENDNHAWSSSRWWYEARFAGPAKFQKLSSDGWKEDLGSVKKHTIERGASLQSSNTSTNYATLSYTFLCVNFPTALPSNCGCSKTVMLKAEYTSKAEVRATYRNGGGGNKESFARAQDFATLLLTRPNNNSIDDIEILGAGSNVLTAECSGGKATSQIIRSAGDIVGGVLDAVTSIKTNIIPDISKSITGLTDKIADLFKLFEEEKGCDSQPFENPLVQKLATLTLQPNEPITVMLLSGSRLETGGKRSWDSFAQINSDFFLTGVLLGGNSAVTETHCCTDYSAQWVYATENRIKTALTQPINSHIFNFLNGTGAVTVNNVPYYNSNYCGGTEIGHATADYQGCEIKVPIYNFR